MARGLKGWSVPSPAWSFTTRSTESIAKPEGPVPTEYSLSQNYPNPFNPSTMIAFGVPRDVGVSLDLHDMLGRKVRSLLRNKRFSPGYWMQAWDGRDDSGITLPSGVYFCHLYTSDYSQWRKLMILR